MDKRTIGIVGGGQLGKMLAEAAHKLNFTVIVLDPTLGSPAGLVADEQIVGSFKDKDKILELGNKVDYMTFEIESANADALEELEKSGHSINPTPKVLKLIKDKFAQKAFLQQHDIKVGAFALVENKEDALKQGEIFGYPYLLKSRFDAYDGRGNFVIKNKDDIDEGFNKLSSGPLYAEKFVPFIKELAVVSVRDTFGNIISYPVVETIHKNNICHIVHSPANVEESVKQKALELSKKVLAELGGVGVFAVEMFLTEDGQVWVNEIAPRVHNSGHHTIEAFTVSQFEQQIRAISHMEVIDPETTSPHAVMINILGERDGKANFVDKKEAPSPSGAHVHIYGKMETRKERKMGHITVLGNNKEEALDKALNARKLIEI